MDAGDIIFDYKSAAKKKEQVGILADLNATDKKTMAQWLADQGCEVDKRLLLPGRMKTAPAEDPVVSQSDEVELTTPEPEPLTPTPPVICCFATWRIRLKSELPRRLR